MKPVLFSRYIVFCEAVQESVYPPREYAEDGSIIVKEPTVLTTLVPRAIIVRNRSKYMPHQGQKERNRRKNTNLRHGSNNIPEGKPV